MKPLLYIDPAGTLLVDSEHPDHFLGAGVSPYAAPFIKWAVRHFDVKWLTFQPPSKTFRLAEHLGLRGHEIPFASIPDEKASAITPTSNFYWVDTHLSPMDVSWLQKHGRADRVLSVTSAEGLTAGHRNWLENKLAQKGGK